MTFVNTPRAFESRVPSGTLIVSAASELNNLTRSVPSVKFDES